MIYSNSAFGPPFHSVNVLTSSTVNFLFGTRPLQSQSFLFAITSVSLAANVATIGVTLKSGGGGLALPTIGAKCGVQGTASNGGIFNVDPSTVSEVDYDAATGVGTISFVLEGADIASTPDVGQMVVQVAVIGDPVTQGTASRAMALSFVQDECDSSRCLFASAVWSGTLPSAAVVVLECANSDSDEQYSVVQNFYGSSAAGTVAASDALAVVADGAITQASAAYQFAIGRFFRARVLSMTGGDDTTALAVLLSA